MYVCLEGWCCEILLHGWRLRLLYVCMYMCVYVCMYVWKDGAVRFYCMAEDGKTLFLCTRVKRWMEHNKLKKQGILPAQSLHMAAAAADDDDDECKHMCT